MIISLLITVVYSGLAIRTLEMATLDAISVLAGVALGVEGLR